MSIDEGIARFAWAFRYKHSTNPSDNTTSAISIISNIATSTSGALDNVIREALDIEVITESTENENFLR